MLQIIIGLSCSLIVVFGFYWQAYVAEKYNEEPFSLHDLDYFDENYFSKRMLIPTWFSIFSILFLFAYLVGIGGWNLLVAIDEKASNTIGVDLSTLFFLGGLALVILIKSYFAPLLVSCSLSWSLYWWFQHDTFQIIPIFHFVIELLLNWAPQWVQSFYTMGLLSYLTISSVVATLLGAKN